MNNHNNHNRLRRNLVRKRDWLQQNATIAHHRVANRVGSKKKKLGEPSHHLVFLCVSVLDPELLQLLEPSQDKRTEATTEILKPQDLNSTGGKSRVYGTAERNHQRLPFLGRISA